MFEDDESVFAALRAGARGYVLKGTDEDDLLRAIRAVAAGEAIFSPTIASRVLTYFSRPAPVPLFPNLTEREREILTLIAQGKNNQTIARELFLSPKTIANHVSNIFAKLQVADRSEAIIRARDAGLGVTDSPLDRCIAGAVLCGYGFIPLTNQNICSYTGIKRHVWQGAHAPGQQIIVPGLVTRHPHSVLDPGSSV